MYIIITGAAGFIGSGIVRYLNDQGIFDLILVDNLDHEGKRKNLKDKTFTSLLSISQLFPWLKGRASEIRAILHLGACSDTLENDWEYLLENNINYTIRLAEYALEHSIRFIYASSAATYGDGSAGFSPELDNLEALKPLNPYGRSKHLVDLWAKKENLFDRLVGLKYFNVFGPNEGHKGRMASMICKMTPLIAQEGIAYLYKSSDPQRFCDGGQGRDFIYVKEAVRRTCAFLDNRLAGLFNIGQGIATTWNELASEIFAALNKPVNIQYIDMPADLVKNYQNYTCAEYKQGIPPSEYSVSRGVREYVTEYLLKGAEW